MKAFPFAILLLTSLFLFSQPVNPNLDYVFVSNNIIGEVYGNTGSLTLALTNMSGYTVRLPLEGLSYLYSYSNYLLVFENSTYYYQSISDEGVIYPPPFNVTISIFVVNTSTMKYHVVFVREGVESQGSTNYIYRSFDGVYAINVSAKVLSTADEEVHGYVAVVPKVEIRVSTFNLVTNSTRLIPFVTTGLPLSFEVGANNFTGQPFVAVNPNDGFLYVITSTAGLQYVVNVVNLSSGQVSPVKISFNGELGGPILGYLLLYNTSTVTYYNPVSNVTLSFPVNMVEDNFIVPPNLVSISCSQTQPRFYPLVTYTNDTNPFPEETLLFFTNYGGNVSVVTVPTVLFCPLVGMREGLPPRGFLVSHNEISLNSVNVNINGKVVPSVSQIYLFNSWVFLNTSHGYLTFDGNLTHGQVVSGLVTQGNQVSYTHYDVFGVNQAIVSNSNLVLNGGSYQIPGGKYVVGTSGEDVVLYGDGEVSVFQVSGLGTDSQGNGLISWVNVGEIAIAIIAVSVIFLTKLLRKRR